MKLKWDPEIDTPATIAVIGGGAVGIEAALYARFLGYYVLLIEAAKMAKSWRRGGHAPMLCCFSEAASRLGQAALEAHRPDSPLPKQSELMTGLGFAERYLVPLARTDLLRECVHVHSRVFSVSRIEARREAAGDIQSRADIEFRLAIHSKNRGWFSERCDIVLDCSGASVPRSLGPGGGLAMGETEHVDVVEHSLPEGTAKLAGRYANTRVLLVGFSLAALGHLLELLGLAQEFPQTRITWLVPLEPGMAAPQDWLERLRAMGEAGARMAEREEIVAALAGTLERVGTLPGLGVERISRDSRGLAVRIQSNEDSTLDIECDRIVAGSGFQADWSHAEAVRLGRSATLDRPIMERGLLADGETEGLESGSIPLAESILTMEPHYYVLGSKSFGLANDRFSLAQGHQQIREVFALIGGRSDLDLYKNVQLSSD